jgi:nitroimidazol reductase NimA-like FMN-containing flavoprotein (pyridoxamine 5'-phosphate oxidase superfamily)
MRREEKRLSPHDALDILIKGEYGVLSISGMHSAPYCVPLSYVYHSGALFFHCAMEGHKLDLIDRNPNVSFCVVGRTRVQQEKFTTAYESAVAFGVARRVDSPEKEDALRALIAKYSPGYESEGEAYIKKAASKTCVIKITIQEISGKASPPPQGR